MSKQDLFLALRAQGKSATDIHDHFVEAFGGLAISYSMVSRTMRKLSWNLKDDEATDIGRRPNELIDARIAPILDDDPEASIREIVHETGIPSSNVPVQLAPHPPNSPDLAPPDLFLFEYLKEKMIGQEFDSRQDVITCIKTAF
jgi:hypothetical protein